jgi:tRNA(Ile2) C34 agmatinyltransferase TiaS
MVVLASVVDWNMFWETYGTGIVTSIIGGLIVVVLIAIWANRNKVKEWFNRRKEDSPKAYTLEEIIRAEDRGEIHLESIGRSEDFNDFNQMKGSKPYDEVEGYALYKKAHIWYKARVAKDDSSQWSLVDVREEPLCTVCKEPLEVLKKRGYNPRFWCPDCQKKHGDPFKIDPGSPYLKRAIEEDLNYKGHITWD